MSAKAKTKLTPQQRKATLTRVLGKIKPYSLFVVCSLVVAAVSVGAQLYIPILCGSAIDMMLGKGAVDFGGVMRIIIKVLVVAGVAALAQWLLSVCNNRITFLVSRDLRNEALRKIQTLPLSYLDSHPSGDIVSRMVADGMRRNECKSKNKADPAAAQGHLDPCFGQDQTLFPVCGVQPCGGRRERGRTAVYPNPLRQRH